MAGVMRHLRRGDGEFVSGVNTERYAVLGSTVPYAVGWCAAATAVNCQPRFDNSWQTPALMFVAIIFYNYGNIYRAIGMY